MYCHSTNSSYNLWFSIFSSLLRQILICCCSRLQSSPVQIMYYQFANLPQLLNLGFVCTMKSSGICFPFFSSSPKAQVSFYDKNLSVVVLICFVVVINFSHFHLLLQNHRANLNQTWLKAFFDEGDAIFFK